MGITGLPDCFLKRCGKWGRSLSKCGDYHDLAWRNARDWRDALRGNTEFFINLWDSGHYIAAPVFTGAVSTIGWLQYYRLAKKKEKEAQRRMKRLERIYEDYRRKAESAHFEE